MKTVRERARDRALKKLRKSLNKGMWDTLTPEQKKAALEYRGPETIGDPNWKKPKKEN